MRHDLDSLIEHLGRTCGLDAATARRVCAECASFWSRDQDAWIRDRHGELQRSGLSNTETFQRLLREMGERPFAARQLTERQLRRRIYG